MKVTLDTNVIVSFVTSRDLNELNKVTKLLKEDIDIYIEDFIATECDFVLRKIYKKSKKEIYSFFKVLLAQRNISSTEYLQKALEYYLNSNIELTDALLHVKNQNNNSVATFDKKLKKLSGNKSYF